ncbi:FAD:protein FMN transferase [Sulfurospirillum oryzae]|uniref:FAD:protein FMN transferase n=1 Tax=Sulfurospirillum oryzae TaxID=2976535 RepID=UPI0021E7B83F|nr:FAD:protein FMN transferase [Sulfurospirillum oryzae]
MYIAHFTAFTTPCEIQLDVTTKEEGDHILASLLSEIERLQKQYSFFESTSEIYAINHRQNDTLSVSQELAGILELALFYARMTQGAFDIALAGTLKQVQKSTSLCEYQMFYDALTPFASFDSLVLEGTTLRFSNPYTQIDLGGIVKEYAVDQTMMSLQKMGIFSALVNFGGDIAAYGTCHNEPWSIGIQDPENSEVNLTIRELHNASLCTSGHSKRYTSIEKQRFSHIIAPMLDESSTVRQNQISIMAPTTVDAGVWSTALLVNPQLRLPKHLIKILEIA